MTRCGKQYNVLCLDPNCARMSMPILNKIAQLAREGVVICGQVPQTAASMTESQDEFDAIVKDIWHSGRKNVYGGKLPADVLAARQIAPDWTYTGAEELRVVHRCIDGGEVYWVCNPMTHSLPATPGQAPVELSLRVKGLIPMKWHPETGEISDVSYRFEGDRTVLELEFDQLEAYFIVLRDKTRSKSGKTVPVQKQTVLSELPIEGLGCWTKDPQTRYFSGTRSFKHSFVVPEFSGRLVIDLGEVKNIAQVFIDGHEVSTLWKAPFKADITDLVKGKTQVELEIKVTNTWRNNLLGDALKPVSERTTYTTFSYFFKEGDELSPSGLFGPVQLIKVE